MPTRTEQQQARALARLTRSAEAIPKAEAERIDAIAAARAAGCTWSKIAEAMGCHIVWAQRLHARGAHRSS